MGGKSSSSSSSTNTTEQTDKRIAAESSIVISDGATSTIQIEDVSVDALEALVDFGGEILGFAADAQKESFRVSEGALERAFDGAAGAENNVVKTLIKWGAVAGGAALAARYAPDLIKALKG